MTTRTFDVELRPIEAIKPYPGNPRVNDDAVDAVAASLKEFGFRQPIVVDAEGVTIVGHTRWKAAKKLGLAQVPVHVATDLPPEKVKAYRIADNQTATLPLLAQAGAVAWARGGPDLRSALAGEIVSLLGDLPRRRALDAGCGQGQEEVRLEREHG